jgi:protein-disulfide isomerase
LSTAASGRQEQDERSGAHRGAPPASTGRPAAHRRPRGAIAAGLALAAAIAVAAVASLGGAPRAPSRPRTPSQKLVAAVGRLLHGIPERGPVLGRASAPVTMTFYADLQCSYCRAFLVYGGFPQLVARQVRAGRVKVVFSPLETATRSPKMFELEQGAVLAAGLQHRLWYYVELLYREQPPAGGRLTVSYLERIARQVPRLRYSAWLRARHDPAFAAAVKRAAAAAASAGVQGTPTVVFRGRGGAGAEPSSPIPDYAALRQAVLRVSRRARVS